MRFAYHSGTLELTSKLGVGLEGGLSIDPSGKPSTHALTCDSSYIARIRLDLSAGLGVGPLSRGASMTAASENTFNSAPTLGVMDWAMEVIET